MSKTILGMTILFFAVGIISCGNDDTTDSGTDSDTDTDSDSDSDSDTDTDSDTSTGWDNMGACFYEGEAVVDPGGGSYVGTEDFALVEIENMEIGDDVCRIRVDVNYVSKAPPGCPECAWAYTLEFSNPVVLTNVDGACENSDLEMDAADIAALDGRQISYGYAYEHTGHWHILFKYDEEKKNWVGATQSASWDEKTGDLNYSSQSGCGY